MDRQRNARLAWTCAMVVIGAAAISSHAATIHALDDGRLGVVGMAAVGPQFVARSATVDDAWGNGDGVANPGEDIYLHLSMRNVGLASGINVRVAAAENDPDVRFVGSLGVWWEWPVGATDVLRYRLAISQSALEHTVTIQLAVTADNGGPWRFVVTFPIATDPIAFTQLDDWLVDPAPDGNGDGRANAGERIRVGIRLRNDGLADIAEALITLTSRSTTLVPVTAQATHTDWPAGEERDTLFLVDVKAGVLTREVPLFVTISIEGVDPWQLSVFVPVVGEDPNFELRVSWLFDPEPGGNRDGMATPGERVLPRVRLRNIGVGDAQDVQVTLSTADPDIGITQGEVTHATWPAGVARNNEGFVLDVASDARAHNTTLVARVAAADGGAWEFDVPFSVVGPLIDIRLRRVWLFDPKPGGNRDGVASPAESVLPRVRLVNYGPSTAQNVRVALAVDDPAVTVTHDETTHTRWEPRVGITHNAFAISVASDATPHDVTGTVHVTADNGGPWAFPLLFPIVYRPVGFVQRNAWIFDPAPGGDGDGQAEAGERLFPRVRLRNAGSEDATNVTVRLTRQEGSVAVVVGEVYHESWPAGEARNNNGFVVDIDRLAKAHDVAFTVTVEAEGGVSEAFQYTFPIASPPVQLVVQDMWLYDGHRNETIEPGEGGWPRLRLRNIGSETATGLRATLIATDDDINLTVTDASGGALAPGQVWDIKRLRFRVDAAATPHDTAVAIVVAADNGGPWRFEIPIPLGTQSGLRVRGVTFADSPSGGNGDGQANAGEAGELRIDVTNSGKRELFNVQTVFTVDDPDITVSGVADPVADWLPAPNTPRTFVFAAEVAPNALPHDFDVTMTIIADDSDPTVYTSTIPIVALPPDFELRSAWVWEPTPGGNGDGDVNPGERVFPRIRLKNIGQGAAQNAQASLVILDPDVEVVSGFVTHAPWPVGEARNNNGLVLDISPNATPHDVQAVLSVFAEDADPWQFSFTIPIVASQVVTTALLANFPNPFNPETWIPFDLSETAEVTVTVYDARGMVVRRLDLGRLDPGTYRGRTDAAYWDGRNEGGEQVSSGAYIYELRAGVHREMRRMIVRK